MRRRPEKELDLVKVHQAISSVVANAPEILNNAQQNDDLSFEDSLHAIETLSRPSSTGSIEEDVGKKLLSCIAAAGQDAQNWKLLVLTIIRKRYHDKSPKAQEIKKEAEDNNTGTGHGERLTFYVLFVILHCLSKAKGDDASPISNHVAEYAFKACECLGKLALPAGGSRDLCALIEHLVYQALLEAGIFIIQKEKGKKRALCVAVVDLMMDGPISEVLNGLLHISVDLLDKDCALVAKGLEPEYKKAKTDDQVKEEENTNATPVKKESKEDRVLQSTINTFIPHNGRGKEARKLVQTVAELLIWSRTKHSETDPKFKKASDELVKVCSSINDKCDSSSDDKIIPLIHGIQTSIRRERKNLNNSSRSQGFALMSSFQIDPSSIDLSMVKAGKQGDISVLQKLATKKADTRVKNLLSARYQDPSKAVPFSSVCAMRREWVALPGTTVGEEGSPEKNDDEIHQLNLKMQEAGVRATIELLRKKISSNKSPQEKDEIVLASLDGRADNDCAAVLVAAALDSRCVWDKEKAQDEGTKVTLFIGENTCSVSSPSDVMALLNTIFTSEKGSENNNDDPAATTKDIQNLIERHLKTKSSLIVFAAADVKLEQRVLRDLQSNDNNIHVHVIDEWSRRMEREKAKIGDVTVTLLWDNECDLDLHCYCPNGDHIFYSEREGGGDVGGGYLDIDMNAGGPYSKEPVENIFFGDAEKGIQAAKGKYKVVVQNYAYHGNEVKNGDPVHWRVRVNMNNEISTYEGQCIGAGNASDTTVVEFEYTGRTVAEPEKTGTALTSSNLVSVTSSHGETMDSLSQLVTIQTEYQELENVRELITEENTEIAEENNSSLMASRTAFELTNRERHFLNLSKLPTSFHSTVNFGFGDSTLADATASSLAKRLIGDGIPVDEIKKAGYPEDLVELVRTKMKTLGV